MWTKRQLIQRAFEEIGLASYVFDLTPEQLESARRTMNAMVGGWDANGVRIGYPFPKDADSDDLDDQCNIPGYAIEAIYLGLALRLAPALGKTVSPETKLFADMAYGNMANQCAIPTPERQLPHTMPRGQGTKPWRNFNNPFINRPPAPILAGSDNPIEFD